MHNYVTAGLFDGLFSNLYLLSTATVLMAVIIALYCANFLKDKRKIGKQAEQQTTKEKTGAQVEQERTTTADTTQQQHQSPEDVDSDENLSGTRSDGLVGKMKTARLKKLEAELTLEQLEEERRIEREQLTAIFDLLKKQEAELNMREIDESELSAQLSLYR